jgi:hypothetical protein
VATFYSVQREPVIMMVFEAAGEFFIIIAFGVIFS